LKKKRIKKGFASLFGMIAFLALAMIGGEARGEASQVWLCVVSLAVFAGSLHMVKRLSTKK